jgi:hypothetical protein
MHKNVEIVRRGYTAFNTGDVGTLTELFEESAAWHTPGRSSLAGDHVGRDAIFAYFGRLGQDTAGSFRAELRYVTADDEGHVVAVHHNSGMRNGKRLDVDCCVVFRLENGRVTDGKEHFHDLHAWEAFWS